MKEIDKLEEYVREVPEDVKQAIKALSENTRLAIVVALLKHGELPFSQLMEILGINSSILSHHLKNLVNASLVKNYYVKKPDSEDYSFYDLTSYGEAFMRSVYGMLDVSHKLVDAIALACGGDKTYGIQPLTYSPGFGEVVLEIEQTRTRMFLRTKRPELLSSLYLSKRKEQERWR